MSAKVWGRANAAKVTAGFILAIVLPPIIDVVTRRWPTGGVR